MISVVSTVRVQDGKAADFEKLFCDLTAKVKANEPGNLVYSWSAAGPSPTPTSASGSTRDQAAFEAHGGADYFLAALGEVGPLMAGEPQVEFFDPVE